MTNSRAKGARGEREFAQFLRERGVEARRGQQFAGGGDSPDVVHDIEGVHFEVKRVERFQLWDAVDQAEKDAPVDHIPVVVHRKNGRKWVAVIDAHELVKLLHDRDV